MTPPDLDLLAGLVRPALRNYPELLAWLAEVIERERRLLTEVPAGAPRGLRLVVAARRRATLASLGFRGEHAAQSARKAVQRAREWAYRSGVHWLPLLDTVRVTATRVVTRR